MTPPNRRGSRLASAGVPALPAGTAVVGEDILAAWQRGAAAVLYGTTREEDGEPLIMLEAVEPGPALRRLGVVAGRGAPRPGEVVLAGDDPRGPTSAVRDGRPMRLVVRDLARYRDRVVALPDAEAVAGRVVLVVGLGSVGSDLGARLVRLGARVIGVDPDHLAVENLIRWGLVAPSSCAGRSKARVFAELLEQAVPGADVAAHRLDVVRDGGAFDRLIAASAPGLLIAATDTRDSRRVINAAAARFAIPALYVALSDGAASVRIEVVADARRGPCHLCSSTAEAGDLLPDDGARRATTPYAAGPDPQAVPALPVDVAVGTAIATRIALTLLAGGDVDPWFRHGEQEGNVLFIALRPGAWIFDEAWQRLVYAPERRADCPVCGDHDLRAADAGAEEER